MLPPFKGQFAAFWAVLVLTPITIFLALFASAVWWVLAIPSSILLLLGLYDLQQTRHAVRRNYPILGNLRFFFESIRPEIRQYFFEDDTQQLPFSRVDRSLVYQRAKQEIDKRPFGTQGDVYKAGYEWINHSFEPSVIADSNFRTVIGGPDCTQPYNMSVLNISAMSFGALSANAVLALNKGA